MTRSDYRPRSGTELIDAAFQLIKSHFSAIITIAAIGCIPMLLARLFIPVPSINSIEQWREHGGALLLVSIPSGITYLLLQGSLLTALSEAYLGRPVVVGASVSAGLRNIGRLLISNVATSILMGLGFILLIIPGFIVGAWMFAVPALIVIERAPLTNETLSRSRALCGDTKLRILGFGLIVFVFTIIFGGVIGVVVALTKSLILTRLTTTLTYLVALPLHMALIVVQYYDARIRKEGYDVELMASTLSPTASLQPATT